MSLDVVWRTRSWDGPIEGVCRYEGRWSYFETAVYGGFTDEDADESSPRVWKIYKMSTANKIIAFLSHFVFRFYVTCLPMWCWWQLRDLPKVEHQELIGGEIS